MIVEAIFYKIVIMIKGMVICLTTAFKFVFAPIGLAIYGFNWHEYSVSFDKDVIELVGIKYYFSKTTQGIIHSLVNIKTAATLIFVQGIAFTLPLREFFYTVIALVFFDMISALYALWRESATFILFYNAWTSKRAFDTVKKSVWYCLFGLVLYIVGCGVGEGELMKKVAMGLIGYIEGKSFIENVDKILGTNFWSLISGFLKDKFLPKSENQNTPTQP